MTGETIKSVDLPDDQYSYMRLEYSGSDESTHQKAAALSVVINGIGAYHVWLSDSARSIDESGNCSGVNYKEMREILDLMKMMSKNTFVGFAADVESLEMLSKKIVLLSEGNNLSSEGERPKLIRVENYYELEQKFYYLRGIWHDVDKNWALIPRYLSTNRGEKAVERFYQAREMIEGWVELLSNQSELSVINPNTIIEDYIGHRLLLPFHYETQELNLSITAENCESGSEMGKFEVVLGKGWLYVYVNELLRNSAKAYDERADESVPREVKFAGKMVTLNELVKMIPPGHLPDGFASSLAGDQIMYVLSATDEGVGVPREIEERGFEIGRSIRGENIPGTGYGISLLSKALKERTGALVAIRNRVDGKRGAEVLLALLARRKI